MTHPLRKYIDKIKDDPRQTQLVKELEKKVILDELAAEAYALQTALIDEPDSQTRLEELQVKIKQMTETNKK